MWLAHLTESKVRRRHILEIDNILGNIHKRTKYFVDSPEFSLPLPVCKFCEMGNIQNNYSDIFFFLMIQHGPYLYYLVHCLILLRLTPRWARVNISVLPLNLDELICLWTNFFFFTCIICSLLLPSLDFQILVLEGWVAECMDCDGMNVGCSWGRTQRLLIVGKIWSTAGFKISRPSANNEGTQISWELFYLQQFVIICMDVHLYNFARDFSNYLFVIR